MSRISLCQVSRQGPGPSFCGLDFKQRRGPERGPPREPGLGLPPPVADLHGEPAGIRTPNLEIKSLLHCHCATGPPCVYHRHGPMSTASPACDRPKARRTGPVAVRGSGFDLRFPFACCTWLSLGATQAVSRGSLARFAVPVSSPPKHRSLLTRSCFLAGQRVHWGLGRRGRTDFSSRSPSGRGHDATLGNDGEREVSRAQNIGPHVVS